MKTKHARKIRLLILVHRYTATSKNRFVENAKEPFGISERLGEALETLHGEEKDAYYRNKLPNTLDRFKDFCDLEFRPTLSNKVTVRVHRKEYDVLCRELDKEKEKAAILVKRARKAQKQHATKMIKFLMEEEFKESAS